MILSVSYRGNIEEFVLPKYFNKVKSSREMRMTYDFSNEATCREKKSTEFDQEIMIKSSSAFIYRFFLMSQPLLARKK